MSAKIDDGLCVEVHQHRLVSWELLRRALKGEDGRALEMEEWRKIRNRCGMEEADYHAIIAGIRKRLRGGKCPEGTRVMTSAYVHS